MARYSVALTVFLAVSAQAAAPTPQSTRYLAVPQEAGGAEIRVARRDAALAEYVLSPELAIELQASLDPEIARNAAVQPAFPFEPGRTLYGWRDRPGLFCDLMRNRGLGSSTACLRDNDGDGNFDDAVRFDFNSARSDLVFITDKGKVRGGRLKSTIPLARPLAYRPSTATAMPQARVRLQWSAIPMKGTAEARRERIEMVVTDGSNFTGTEILSDQVAIINFSGKPVEVPFYGFKVGIESLTEDGQLRYTLSPLERETTIGFVFRGYQLRIIMY